MKKTGIVLIVLGIIMMVITGFNFVTREKIVDIGSLEIEGNKNHAVQWSPIVGAALLATGFVALMVRRKKAF